MRAPRATARSQSSRTRAPAPSVMTNPSRRTSKGREFPEVDRAVMLVKAAMPTPVMPASAAPPMATSHRPEATSRAAWPMLWAPAAQAVMIVSDGPCQPSRMETAAAPALDIIIGHQAGRDPPGALLAEDQDLGLEGLEAAHPGAHDHAGPARVGVRARRRRSRAMSATATLNWANRSSCGPPWW